MNTDQINQNRRRFMRNAAMTLAAAELVTISSAVAQPGKNNDKNMTPAAPIHFRARLETCTQCEILVH